jgi:hypothetical protein
MGIARGHSLLYSISNVTFFNICRIARERAKLSKQIVAGRSQNPVLDIDASWLLFVTNPVCSIQVQKIIEICLVFAKVGFDVVLICDGNNRHFSKRATTDRVFNKQKGNTNLYLHQCQYSRLIDKFNKDDTSNEEKDLILKETDILRKKIRTVEKQVTSQQYDSGDVFFKSLTEHISELTINDYGGNDGSITAVQAEFQADSVIASRTIKRYNDIVLCSDSDQAALCGHRCLSIKSFVYKKKNNNITLEPFKIFTTMYDNIKDIGSIIDLSLASESIKKPVYPLFDNLLCEKIGH